MSEPNLSSLSPSMQHQLRIYLSGTKGIRPKIPVSFEELEKKAEQHLSEEAFGYIYGGAGSEITRRNNKDAFNEWQIIPRVLTDVSRRNIGTELFGKRYSSPLLFAPVGVLSLANREGDIAVAEAAKNLNVPQVVSTVSSFTMEEIAKAGGDNLRWFQLYWGSDKEFTNSLIKRAEDSGYEAIVVTLDTRVFAWRETGIKNAYLPFLFFQGLANYLNDPVFLSRIGDPANNRIKALLHFSHCFSNPASTWEDLAEIKNATDLPIIIKGILHPDDAEMAVKAGVDGIIVSNHGGRQLDGAMGALNALPKIAERVGDKTTLLFDSGIRRGADVFKAMALGAKAVLVGRPYVYGLALDGREGVELIIKNLLADTDLTLGLAGCKSWSETSQKNLLHKPNGK